MILIVGLFLFMSTDKMLLEAIHIIILFIVVYKHNSEMLMSVLQKQWGINPNRHAAISDIRDIKECVADLQCCCDGVEDRTDVNR
jgi:hypothetical protein